MTGAELVRSFAHAGERFRVVRVNRGRGDSHGLVERAEKDALGAERWVSVATFDEGNPTATLLFAALLDAERGRVQAAAGFPTREAVANVARAVYKAQLEGREVWLEEFVDGCLAVVDALRGKS